MKTTTPNTPLQGAFFALTAAALFGATMPFSKLLLGSLKPVLLAGLLYLGSGAGLAVWRWLRSRFKGSEAQEAGLTGADLPWLAGAIFSGGVVGPVLLMVGLLLTPASSASLLLNLEGVFTAVLAWFVFMENFDRRIALGMTAITAGGVLLSWSGQPALGVPWGVLAIIGACLAWGIDNNLTRKVSAGDPLQIAMAKGLIAGAVNLIVALAAGTQRPSLPATLLAALVGFFGYGVSLMLFVLALRHIGTARTGAYFSFAPFVGAAISIAVLGDRLTPYFVTAAVLMGIGLFLHLTERHAHDHQHELLEHEHRHVHDEHHLHEHAAGVALGEPHSHSHQHDKVFHSHPHYPDIHHRHGHRDAKEER
ncbi:MAG TPA: EamA family transporter [Blastocatellia bacterium]|nr:EamA family transporter [Blastocatellia bacterium]